jgi:hypothetical protein
MRFRLRTLLILMAVGPPMLAGTWTVARAAYDEGLFDLDPVSVVIVIAFMHMLVALEYVLVPIHNRKLPVQRKRTAFI